MHDSTHFQASLLWTLLTIKYLYEILSWILKTSGCCLSLCRKEISLPAPDAFIMWKVAVTTEHGLEWTLVQVWINKEGDFSGTWEKEYLRHFKLLYLSVVKHSVSALLILHIPHDDSHLKRMLSASTALIVFQREARIHSLGQERGWMLEMWTPQGLSAEPTQLWDYSAQTLQRDHITCSTQNKWLPQNPLWMAHAAGKRNSDIIVRIKSLVTRVWSSLIFVM